MPLNRPLNAQQQSAIGDLLRDVFVMLRAPGYTYFWTPEMRANGDLVGIRYAFERSIALGEAFHNVPLHMQEADFWFSFHKNGIRRYVTRFPEFAEYIRDMEEIEKLR